ncbi:hypothetical protein [Defluviitalea phaphyphila]|uniref:hypothetical protein n=1 Tax=Defluviitalea phaphyphila TaxID=1473580 RepID=UPI000730C2B1|nr:hypothetical protein [Defluviitalea phaphyphila]
MENKGLLLEASERAAEFINKNHYSNFISKILELLHVAKYSSDDEYEQKQKFFRLLYQLKNSAKIEIIGGGKELKNGFKEFVDKYIKLKKKEGFILENEDFKDCTLEEIEYILGWTRRLIKEDKNKNTKNKNFNKKVKYKRNYRGSKNMSNNSIGSSVMQNAFKGLDIKF